ncbi:MAG: alpha/beta fold hydrolase [Rhodobacteraceae bacterium]|nr:alpha/beta fold hydrolase [Paracoccaceae bacterium]
MSGMVAWKALGSGEAIVFLHGVGGGAESFDAQLSHFGAHGFRALAWDMPGYGASPQLDAPGFTGWADALRAGLDAEGIGDCILVGHSIGGMIAQTFVARHPERVRTLVLSATSPAFGNPDGDFQRAFIAERLGPLERGETMEALAAAFVPGLVGRAATPDITASARASMARVRPGTYRAAMEALVQFDARATLADITCPALLIAGAEDTSAPPRVMERMASRMQNARLVCLEGVGHLGNLEQPDAFNRAIEAFLGGL